MKPAGGAGCKSYSYFIKHGAKIYGSTHLPNFSRVANLFIIAVLKMNERLATLM
jgi:hypothetical protein